MSLPICHSVGGIIYAIRLLSSFCIFNIRDVLDVQCTEKSQHNRNLRFPQRDSLTHEKTETRHTHSAHRTIRPRSSPARNSGFNADQSAISNHVRSDSMPFIFRCSRCGSTLYKDPNPVLDIGSYKRHTYLETVLTELGGKCPSCGHKLHIPPLEIEVLAPKKEGTPLRKRHR